MKITPNGEKIKEIMEKGYYKKRQLARVMGITVNTLNKMLDSEPVNAINVKFLELYWETDLQTK